MALMLFLVAAPFGKAQKLSRHREERDSAEQIRMRGQWFFHLRAAPLGFIPGGARLRALRELDRALAAQRLPATQQGPENVARINTAGAGTTWVQIGPQPALTALPTPMVSGRVDAIAVDPNDTTGNTAYLGPALGGVWKTTNGGVNWTPMTDFQPSLAVGSLAIDPSTTPSTVYVGTGEENFAGDSYYGAGVLKSADGGVTWTQDSTFTAAGVTPLDQFSGAPRIGALAINPLHSQMLLAAVQGFSTRLESGVWCSENGGASWTHVLPDVAGVPATDVVFTSDGTAWAALGFIVGDTHNGVYKSNASLPITTCSAISGSAKWNVQNLPFTASQMGRIALGAASTNPPGEIFAAIADGTTISGFLLGVAKTTNANAASPTWSKLTGSALVQAGFGFCDPQCFYDLTIKVSPTNPSLVFAGGAAQNATLIRSLDGGNTWTEVSNNASANPNGLHVDMHSIAFLPPTSMNANPASVVYVGNDGGVWNTTGPAATPITWSNLNEPLATLQFYPGISLHPSNPNFRTFGGTQDNGALSEVSGNLAWRDTGACGDGTFTVIDPQTPSNVYITCEFLSGAFLQITKSVQNGDSNIAALTTTFFLAQNGIDVLDRGGFVPPLVVDPSNGQRLYFGTCRVWQTIDGANSWHAISPDLTGQNEQNCSNPNGAVLTAIAVAPSNSSTIYTGADNGLVEVTTNGGATWAAAQAGLPPRAVTATAVSPSSSTTAYATFSGFSGFVDNLGHTFMTVNGGATWTDISGPLGSVTSLPNIPVNDIVIDPDMPGVLYVATDIGVYQTFTGGTTWSPLGMNSLPHAAVLSLKMNHPTRTLRAATHGRSVWEWTLGGLPAFSLGTISPASANAGGSLGAGPNLTVTGTGFTANSKVTWNGSPLVTVVSGATTMQATVPDSDLATGGLVQVDVLDSTQIPSTTNSLAFTVLNATPVISSLTPPTASAPAAADLSLSIGGSNFNSSSAVQFNGTNLTQVSFNPATGSLTATIPKGDLQFGGSFSIVVVNPTPGGGPSNSLNLVVTAAPPSNDSFNTPIVASGTSFSAPIVDSSGASANTGGINDPNPTCATSEFPPPLQNGDARSVWYKYVPTADGTIEADTIGSSYDTILSVWTGAAGNLQPVPNGCNDDIVPGINVQSQVTGVRVTAGTAYFFMVSAFSGDGGESTFNLNASLSQPNYSASAAPSNFAGVTAGQRLNSTITFSPGTFNGMVNLTCAVTVGDATIGCSLNPAQVTLSSAPPVTSALTITTTPRAAVPPAGTRPTRPLVLWIVGLAVVSLLLAMLMRGPARRRRLALGFSAVLVFALLALQVACGGGGSSGGGGTTGTQPGNYTVTVTENPAANGGPVIVTFTVQ